MWNDAAILALEKEISAPPLKPGEGRLTLNILLSGAASKFFKLKSPELISLRNWSKSWEDPIHHWVSNWRCEDCFGRKGTKERIFVITNEASRFSFILRLAPGDIRTLFKLLHEKLMSTIKGHGGKHPSTVQLNISTLYGSARSLTGFQNNLRSYLDCIIEDSEFKPLEDLEKRLNKTPTSSLDFDYPCDGFARLCHEEPPFPEESANSNIVPFLN
ncbi:hypothetical protein N9891_00410 [bacterium]|nr:hypothetical protein [bacterium]